MATFPRLVEYVQHRVCLTQYKDPLRALTAEDFFRDNRFLNHTLRMYLWHVSVALQTAASLTSGYCGPI